MHFVSVAVVAVIILKFGVGKIEANNNDERSVSTSVMSMVPLLDLERFLIMNLEEYANELEKKLTIVRSGIHAMRVENDKSVKDTEAYLSNPLHSFPLIRRMHMDWVSWEMYMQAPVGKSQTERIENYRSQMPSDIDLDEAVKAMQRLQSTYGLVPMDMAKGVLQGTQYDARLTSMDCYKIGVELLRNEQFYYAGFWLYAAYQAYEENPLNEVYRFKKLNIMTLYAETLVKQNRPGDALHMLDAAIKESPTNANLLQRRAEVQELSTLSLKVKMPPRPTEPKYESGCRGEYPVNATQRLYCFYNTTTTPFLRIAPIKVEILELNPYMLLFHDIISDSEIAGLKEMAAHSLKRATVFSEREKKSVVIDNRTSKFAWFPNASNNLTLRINQRIIDMTGFNIDGSEMLQIMNYGLGGHYSTHFDYFGAPSDADIVRMQGDRVATVLFYLTDVEKGGATVFPHIEKAVFPRKGTAVMWYNLNNNGEGNKLTMHAACPVIVGSKWVCNKWIRERNQTFTKPCYKE